MNYETRQRNLQNAQDAYDKAIGEYAMAELRLNWAEQVLKRAQDAIRAECEDLPAVTQTEAVT